MKKFIIATNQATSEQQNAITKLVKDMGWGYWHWFENLWLLQNVPDDWAPGGIHATLIRDPILKECSLIVMSVSDPISYWGNAPQESWSWMFDKWGAPR
jgi:hypothetical protein